jgi:hypothetical protein
MGWGAGTVMTALCAVCTGIAQKPGNANGGGSNAPSQTVSPPLNGMGGNPFSGQEQSSAQQPQQGVASAPQDGGSDAPETARLLWCRNGARRRRT